MAWGSGLSQKVLGVWRENEKGGQTCAPGRIRRGCFRRVSFVDSPTLKGGTVPKIGLFIRYQLCLISPGVWKWSDPIDQRLLVTIASEADRTTSDKSKNGNKAKPIQYCKVKKKKKQTGDWINEWVKKKSSNGSTNSSYLSTNNSYMNIYHPWKWHPTLVLLPGESHGWRSLVGYSPWGRKE